MPYELGRNLLKVRTRRQAAAQSSASEVPSETLNLDLSTGIVCWWVQTFETLIDGRPRKQEVAGTENWILRKEKELEDENESQEMEQDDDEEQEEGRCEK